VKPVEIRGLEGLRQRLAALGTVQDLRPALREQADTVAFAAKATLTERDPGSRLAQSIGVKALGSEDQPAYAIGSNDPAAFFVEFGTAKRRATPFLTPAFHQSLPRINQGIRKVIEAALKRAAKV
jgi:HK97 gp10 family phage protein